MYFPLGWPRTLSQNDDGSPLKYVACNRYRMLFALLTDETINIWHCRPCVEILSYERGKKSIAEKGSNVLTEWRHDSSMLAVATTHGFLLIYQLEQDVKAEKGINLFEYNQKKAPQGESGDGVPALRLCLKAEIKYGSPIVSLSCVSDELLIATSNGELELIPWFGSTDSRKLISVQDMTFSVDLHSTGSNLRSKHPLHILEVTYSPCLEGFTAVLSDGRAALIFITKSGIDEKTKSFVWKAHGIWANGLSKAVCSAVNNRYRLMAFGTSRGSCEVYSMDDVLGCLQFSHQMMLSPKYYPDVYKNTGAVLDMQWTPDGCALALSWHHGGLSVWSVYGSCLYSTLSADHAFTPDGIRKQQSLFHSMCWGAEGYHLWVIQESKIQKKTSSSNLSNSLNHTESLEASNLSAQSNASSSSDETYSPRVPHTRTETNHNTDGSTACSRQFIQVQFAKSALTMNPCSGNQSHVIIQAEDRLYVSFGENRYTSLLSTTMYDERKKRYITKTFIEPGSPGRSFESVVGNKQWTVIQLPTNYLNGNWPIRFASIDKTGKLLGVAGNFGLAHYSFITRKWKLFGNIMQEKDMVVTGGLTWWDGLIVVACYNLVESQDEIRIYPHNSNLDNVFSYVKRVSSQVLLINVYLNMVIIFDATCHIKIYQIKKEDKTEYTSASLTLLKDISMQRFVPYPSLVVSVMMASLHMESTSRKHMISNQKETEVLIINVAGRLLLLQHQQDDVSGQNSLKQGGKELNFHPPIVLASQVENIWASEYKSTQKVHLTDALWLCCGSAGVRVWLPLFPPLRRSRSGDVGEHDVQALLSKRITLTLEMDSCYPLTVLFENAVLIGVKTETSYNDPSARKGHKSMQYSFPFSTLERTCEMYLHQILRQLLRRNLGYHALQIALSCRSLSYFPHVLELMLHKVLEEEATASAPIPDPLLPTIVKFIMEFPEYLETIVHCARKTEIALWQYLFNSVGSPKEHFEECLEANQLETAASYLIILQNLEKLTLARQDATRLLSQALAAKKWSLASDIIRFLRAIGDGDQSATPRHPQLLNTNIYPAVAPPPHQAIEDNAFSDNKVECDATGKQSDPTVRHSRRFSNYYELYPQKSTAKPPQTLSLDKSSSSYHPYVPQYPLSSYPRHRPLQASLSHPPSTDIPPPPARSEVNKLSPIDEQNMVPECAEHYFIDVILSRQARSLLSEKNLFQLATFAAYLEFDLLPWLQKERTRAARVSDAAECLVAVHSSFNWPYPSIVKLDASPRKSSTSQRSGMWKTRSMDTLSQASTSASDMLGLLSVSENTAKNSAENFEMSDTSSINDDLANSVLDILCENYKVDRSGESPETREQLSQVFDLMLNALCLEWCIVLAIVLHDLEKLCQIISVIRSDKSPDLKLETLQRTRESALHIKKWAAVNCLPYEKVLLSMQEQLDVLHDLVNEREVEYAEQQAVIAQQQSQLSSPESTDRKITRSRHTSKEEAAKKEEPVKDGCPEEVLTEANDPPTEVTAKEERTRHVSVSQDDNDNSETDSEEISDDEVGEGCAIS